MVVNKPIVGVAVAIFVLAVGGVYYLRSRNAPLPAAPRTPVAASPSRLSRGLPIRCRPAARTPPRWRRLPPLAESDMPLRDALTQISSAEAVKDFLAPQDVIRKMVVTIDNLPRQKVAVEKRPVNPPTGTFAANGDELHATLDQRNFDRYKPMVAAIEHVDMKQLGRLYIHYYPLFQESYQNLGYPNGYFNDRLVEVIDNLLAAPEPKQPIQLVRPNVMYTFADPALESRSAGQKLLIRMGPENAKVIKAKLTELKAAITGGSAQALSSVATDFLHKKSRGTKDGHHIRRCRFAEGHGSYAKYLARYRRLLIGYRVRVVRFLFVRPADCHHWRAVLLGR